MSVPFFYEPTIQETQQPIILSDATSKHCTQVLRMRAGETLHLTDGKGKLFYSKIISADKQKTVAIIEQIIETLAPEIKRSIGISLLKNADRFEWMLEKITEIGVAEIYPLICKRTEQLRFRQERMEQIVIAAMLQSQQTWLPILHQTIDIKKLIEKAKNHQKLIAHCEEDNKNLLNKLTASDDSLILIGPEGDFTLEEISIALNHHFIPVSLGVNRLRSETAGVVSITILANI